MELNGRDCTSEETNEDNKVNELFLLQVYLYLQHFYVTKKLMIKIKRWAHNQMSR